MKASKMLISTLKEAPQEAKIASHVLLLRAGMMKNLVGGVYNFLPLGLRVLHKIENVIREEITFIDVNVPTVIASGPLTSDDLSQECTTA